MTVPLRVGIQAGGPSGHAAPNRAVRRIRPAAVAFARADINVTPLVDVVLVLLIIFMVVTPLVEKTIDLRVPPLVTAAAQPPSSTREQIVVYLAADGTTRIGGDLVDLAALADVLRARIAARSSGDRAVFVGASDQASYGSFVTLMDCAKRAGAEVLGLAPLSSDSAASGDRAGAETKAPP